MIFSALSPIIGAVLLALPSCIAKPVDSLVHFALQVDAPSQKYMNGAYLDMISIDDTIAKSVGIPIDDSPSHKANAILVINLGNATEKILSPRMFVWGIDKKVGPSRPLLYYSMNHSDEVNTPLAAPAPLSFLTKLHRDHSLPGFYPGAKNLNTSMGVISKSNVINTKYPGTLDLKVVDDKNPDKTRQWVVCDGGDPNAGTAISIVNGVTIRYKYVFWAPPKPAHGPSCTPIKFTIVPCKGKVGKPISEGMCAK